MHWNANTAQAAKNPKIESTVVRVSEPSSSPTSSPIGTVPICVGDKPPVDLG
jgi:hypothetical protein